MKINMMMMLSMTMTILTMISIPLCSRKSRNLFKMLSRGDLDLKMKKKLKIITKMGSIIHHFLTKVWMKYEILSNKWRSKLINNMKMLKQTKNNKNQQNPSQTSSSPI